MHKPSDSESAYPLKDSERAYSPRKSKGLIYRGELKFLLTEEQRGCLLDDEQWKCIFAKGKQEYLLADWVARVITRIGAAGMLTLWGAVRLC